MCKKKFSQIGPRELGEIGNLGNSVSKNSVFRAYLGPVWSDFDEGFKFGLFGRFSMGMDKFGLLDNFSAEIWANFGKFPKSRNRPKIYFFGKRGRELKFL